MLTVKFLQYFIFRGNTCYRSIRHTVTGIGWKVKCINEDGVRGNLLFE